VETIIGRRTVSLVAEMNTCTVCGRTSLQIIIESQSLVVRCTTGCAPVQIAARHGWTPEHTGDGKPDFDKKFRELFAGRTRISADEAAELLARYGINQFGAKKRLREQLGLVTLKSKGWWWYWSPEALQRHANNDAAEARSLSPGCTRNPIEACRAAMSRPASPDFSDVEAMREWRLEARQTR
jgi:hypothetical protein